MLKLKKVKIKEGCPGERERGGAGGDGFEKTAAANKFVRERQKERDNG